MRYSNFYFAAAKLQTVCDDPYCAPTVLAKIFIPSAGAWRPRALGAEFLLRPLLAIFSQNFPQNLPYFAIISRGAKAPSILAPWRLRVQVPAFLRLHLHTGSRLFPGWMGDSPVGWVIPRSKGLGELRMLHFK